MYLSVWVKIGPHPNLQNPWTIHLWRKMNKEEGETTFCLQCLRAAYTLCWSKTLPAQSRSLLAGAGIHILRLCQTKRTLLFLKTFKVKLSF